MGMNSRSMSPVLEPSAGPITCSFGPTGRVGIVNGADWHAVNARRPNIERIFEWPAIAEPPHLIRNERCFSISSLERVLRADRVAGPKAREGLGHAFRVLHLKAKRGLRKNESFRVGQPQQQAVGLAETGPEGVALAAKHRKHGLGDAPDFRFTEGPVPQPRDLLLEPGPSVGHRLMEGARHGLVDGGTIARSEPGPQKFVQDHLGARLLISLLSASESVPVKHAQFARDRFVNLHGLPPVHL